MDCGGLVSLAAIRGRRSRLTSEIDCGGHAVVRQDRLVIFAALVDNIRGDAW